MGFYHVRKFDRDFKSDDNCYAEEFRSCTWNTAYYRLYPNKYTVHIRIFLVWFDSLHPSQKLYGHVETVNSPSHIFFLGKPD